MKLCLAAYSHRLASLFDNASSLLLYEADKQGYWQKTAEIRVSEKDGAYSRARLLLEFRVEILICGGISHCTKRMLQSSGVQVLDWLRGDIQQVLAAWNAGDISGLSMPGCGRRCRSFQQHRSRKKKSSG